MSLFRDLRRDISKEFHVSRNLRESWGVGFLRCVVCAWFLVKAFVIGVRCIRQECIGSQVIYNGRKVSICNWAGSAAPTLSADGYYEQNVPREQITSVFNLRELWHRFSFGVTFYTGYHMDNDINKALYPRAFARN